MRHPARLGAVHFSTWNSKVTMTLTIVLRECGVQPHAWHECVLSYTSEEAPVPAMPSFGRKRANWRLWMTGTILASPYRLVAITRFA